MSSPDAREETSDDVEAIIHRAGLLGIPAWRVTTALGNAQTPTYLAAGIPGYRAG